MRLKDKIHWIEYYMRMTGGREIEEDEWDDVGAFALEHDCPEPSVPTKTHVLGKQFARAAGQWYERNNAGHLQRKLIFVPGAKPEQGGLWCDTDDNISRRQIERVVQRRIQLAVGLLAGARDTEQDWRAKNLDEEAIPVPTDLEFDVELRRAAAAAEADAEREEKAG